MVVSWSARNKFTRATMPCSRNDNVGGTSSHNYALGCSYDHDFAARDDYLRANYHHTRTLHLYTSRRDHYNCSGDHNLNRRLHYDASPHNHYNATCHHHFHARSVSLRRFTTHTLRFLSSLAFRPNRRRRTTRPSTYRDCRSVDHETRVCLCLCERRVLSCVTT